MIKNRILFGIWLLIWTFVWIAGQNRTAVLIAIASILCEAAEIPIARYFCKNISAEVQSSPSLQKGTKTQIALKLGNPTRFSGNRCICTVLCENLLTGEKNTMHVPFALPGKAGDTVQAEAGFEHCGKIAIRITEICAYDIFGIYRAKKPMRCSTASLVLPQLYPTNLSVSPGQITDIESDEYSHCKAGFDASETFALRSYKEGDAIKQIHWKLSQKADEMIVRELSLPIKNSLLILLDNVCHKETSEPEPELAEAMGEMAVSISMELCEMNYEHHIAWLAAGQKEIKHCEINSEEELNGAMPEILSAGMQEDSISIFERMTEANMEYAHIIALTAQGQGAEGMLPAETKLSILDIREYREFEESGIYVEV